jgi:hypothetical protein
MQITFMEPGVWDIQMPRRHGKTTLLRQYAQKLASAPWPIFCYAPSPISRANLGVPVLSDVPDRPIILLLDDYNLCQNAQGMQAYVIEAGGIVIRTSTPQ